MIYSENPYKNVIPVIFFLTFCDIHSFKDIDHLKQFRFFTDEQRRND